MTTAKKTTKKRSPRAASVRTIADGDAVVNIGTVANTTDTVTVLFRSRFSQTFRLRSGKEVTINGNAVYLANARGGALPAGGYGVTTVDKSLWDQVMKEYGQAYRPWLQSGRLKVVDREETAVNYALDNAGDKTGDDPIPRQDEEVQ